MELRKENARLTRDLGRSMARAGWHVATGGGPGAMEAANLGAWLAPHPDAALDAALELLAVEERRQGRRSAYGWSDGYTPVLSTGVKRDSKRATRPGTILLP